MSYTVDIPGGTATLLEASEMTPRRTRAMEVVQFRYPSLMRKLAAQAEAEAAAAKAVEGTDAAPAEVPDPELSEAEAEVLGLMQDATVYAQLASWTLDIPRPETVDAVQDIPLGVYQALKAAIQAGRVDPATDPNSFEPNDATVQDDASPFPNSASSDSTLPAEPVTDSTPTP